MKLFPFWWPITTNNAILNQGEKGPPKNIRMYPDLGGLRLFKEREITGLPKALRSYKCLDGSVNYSVSLWRIGRST